MCWSELAGAEAGVAAPAIDLELVAVGILDHALRSLLRGVPGFGPEPPGPGELDFVVDSPARSELVLEPANCCRWDSAP